ncbi:hypothetical protein [Homoserinibacter sp. GY 40078]|uniref:hypothetical protein n=1 Tax=Homoserinibacter sp. GY 40078 TaxID=2603275 RepID=UPI0011C76D3E|nr:hypothetical protein [Homoserinibacter sp. GY 40078]TXK17383.1 hypothetical protein FVQ89_11150 [Homoserinibacter sp. GY 40078]
MSARIDYCDTCGMEPVIASRPGVWRFDGREGLLLRFRFWQIDPDLSAFTLRKVAHATTETYTIAAAVFWGHFRHRVVLPLDDAARSSGWSGAEEATA